MNTRLIHAVAMLTFLSAALALAACGGESQAQLDPQGMTQQNTALAASGARAMQSHDKRVRYTLVYTGTLGGLFANPFGINQAGVLSGSSWLPGNTNYHADMWKGRDLIDLGTLGGPNSESGEINDVGVVVGFAETATADPLGEDFCATGTHMVCSATIWRHGNIVALQTFGGPNSGAQSNNDRDQTVGVAETTLHDSTCTPPQVLQYEAAVWTGTHRPQQLPTYPGDPDSSAWAINERGYIVGQSGPCGASHDAPRPLARYSGGISGQRNPGKASHTRVVMWRNGKVIDLGSLGGSYGAPFHINDRDQVVGYSNLPGDAINHAFLWQKGVMNDLSPLAGNSFSAAYGMNDAGQVVGQSWSLKGNGRHFATYHAVIWQHGAVTDLNSLVPPYSLRLLTAGKINDSGVIVGLAYDAQTGIYPGFVAIPNR